MTPDRITHAAVLHDVAIYHTAKCCTNTVVRKLMPPMNRVEIEKAAKYPVTVGLVRHPVDRFVSSWADTTRPHRVHLIAENRYTHEPIPGIHAGMPITEFADVVQKFPLSNRHWLPQSEWLLFNGKYPDRILFYESIADDWAALAKEFPYLPAFPAERMNASPRGPWQDVVKGSLLAQVCDIYREDFRVFGYSLPRGIK